MDEKTKQAPTMKEMAMAFEIFDDKKSGFIDK
jgi:Ca2+-binding EF-hand superfamily protein